MASRRSSGANGAEDDAAGDASQLLAQGLAQIQEALRLQEERVATALREMERKLQEKDDAIRALQQRLEETQERVTAVEERTTDSTEALRLQEERAATALREMERKLQEKDDAIRALQQRLVETQERVTAVEERTTDSTEALRLQEERAATALREMERKLQEKDDAIRALQRRLEETQERVTAVEERTSASEGSGGGVLQCLEGRVNEVEASLQRAVQKFMPRVEALLHQLEEPQSTRACLAISTSAASAREAPTAGGIATGGGEEPHSSAPTHTSSGAGHQGAAADEDERARQQVERRVREVELRMEEARNSPSPLGEQLCKAAEEGRLNDVRRLLDSGADVNYIDGSGSTPLINAAWFLHADVMSLLLQRGADANAVNCSGYSALHCAAWNDRSGRCVELLLRSGADVDARDKDGETPVHYAAVFNNEAARALVAAGVRRGLKPWGGCWENKTPFDIATSSNTKALLRLQHQE